MQTFEKFPRTRLALAALAAAAGLAACGGDDDHPPLTITTVSNRADLISDGDALVETTLPAGASGLVRADVDGVDVSSAFAMRANGKVTGLVTGLKDGANVLSVSAVGATDAKLTITNAGRGGPVYSGAQPLPFVCATPTPLGATATSPATNGSGLSSAATDVKCNIPTEYKLYYKTTATGCSSTLPDPQHNMANYLATTPTAAPAAPASPCFKPYTVGTTPADLASTKTDAGLTVPYIVRVERGTMNRGIYDIAVLFDPTKPWTAVAPQAQWNGKIQYTFGASTG